jgi:ribosomal protein L35
MKSNKSYLKRIRVTKKGKLMARKTGQGAFNSKERSSAKSGKKSMQSLKFNSALRRRFLPGV